MFLRCLVCLVECFYVVEVPAERSSRIEATLLNLNGELY